MAIETLRSLVLKTESVSVKLTTPAARIGAGVPMDRDNNPATFLFQGQFLPQLPEPEPQARLRRKATDLMSMPSVGAPAGSAGRFPGSTVRWCPKSLLRESSTGSRASYPGSQASSVRLGRDCQSPDRTTDATDLKARTHADWHRTATPTTAAAK